MHASSPSLVGVVFDGRYTLVERIGTGGFGVVYRARQETVGRDVAVKLLTVDAAAKDGVVQRFRHEAEIIARLRHPSALKLIDLGHAPDGRLYVVTEFVDGLTLSDELDYGRFDQARTIKVMRAVSGVLTEAHAAGVIHRDIKPGNIMLEAVGGHEVVKVLDFGIARLAGSQQTLSGAIFGTPAYMSPEQAAGAPVDHRCDLYSLGVVAYGCLVGEPPFSADSALALLMMQAHDPPPPLMAVDPPVDAEPELCALIHRLLAKAPNDRPATAAAVLAQLDALEGVASSGPISRSSAIVGTPGPPTETLAERPRDPQDDSSALLTPLGVGPPRRDPATASSARLDRGQNGSRTYPADFAAAPLAAPGESTPSRAGRAPRSARREPEVVAESRRAAGNAADRGARSARQVELPRGPPGDLDSRPPADLASVERARTLPQARPDRQRRARAVSGEEDSAQQRHLPRVLPGLTLGGLVVLGSAWALVGGASSKSGVDGIDAMPSVIAESSSAAVVADAGSDAIRDAIHDAMVDAARGATPDASPDAMDDAMADATSVDRGVAKVAPNRSRRRRVLPSTAPPVAEPAVDAARPVDGGPAVKVRRGGLLEVEY